MRGQSPRGPIDPYRVSASRVNSLLACGVAFEMRYVQGLPSNLSGAAALFGSVMHEALEHWAVNRRSDLVALTRSAWLTVTENTPVRGYLGAYQALSLKALKQEAAIREARPDIKMVRQTKDWKESSVAKSILSLGAQWSTRIEQDSPWRFKNWTELPALYDESLTLAKRYQWRWSHLPDALYAELAFDVKWEDWFLTGYIDDIEPVVDSTGELVAILVNDYKSYAQEPALAKDWRQTVMYDIAVRDLIERGVLVLPDVPIYVGLDYLRLTPKPGDADPFASRRMWRVGELDYARLRRELTHYTAIVAGGHFMPAEKGRKADFCDYPEDCCLTQMPSRPIDASILDARRAAA